MREVDDPRFFLAIVRNGSLAGAARALNVTPSAITQRLQALEAKLGVRLVDRSSRKLQLTDEGELFATDSAVIIERFDSLVDAVQSRRLIVRGHLRVLGTLGFGRTFLAPIVAAFHESYPQVEPTLTLSDRWVVDHDAAYDVVIHIGALLDSSAVAFRIAPNERYLLASPAYLKKYGAPQVPNDLLTHACLVLRENDDDVTLWRFIGARRKEHTVRVPSALASNDGDVIKQWALAGKGVMIRSEWDVAKELRAGRLVRLLPQWKLPEANIVALVPQRRGMTSRSRAFIEFLAARFEPLPPWRQQ